jgi:hypothetical protein
MPMSKHQIEWNAASQEWFCINCLRASDSINKADAEVELNAFDCIQPEPRVQSSSH